MTISVALPGTVVVASLDVPAEAGLEEAERIAAEYDAIHLTCVEWCLDLAGGFAVRGDHWTPRRGRAIVLRDPPSPSERGKLWMLRTEDERANQALRVSRDLVARGKAQPMADLAGAVSLDIPRDETARILAALTGRGLEYATERVRHDTTGARLALAERMGSIEAGSPAWLVPAIERPDDSKNRRNTNIFIQASG